MTKKKIVIKIETCICDKLRKKAFAIAAAAYGVESVTNDGKDKDLLTVIGICVDAVCLVVKLRKKVGWTELVSVEDVKEEKPKEEKPKEEKEEKPKEEKPPNHPFCMPSHPSCVPPHHPSHPSCVPPCPPQLFAYGTVYDPSPSICSIM